MKKRYNFPKDQFYLELKKFRDGITPQPSDFIGKTLMELIENLSYKDNFRNYPQYVRDEMFSNALFKCVKGLDKFDMTRKNNVFSYFTKISWFAFLDVIMLYYKDLNIKRDLLRKFLEKSNMNEETIKEMVGEEKFGNILGKGYSQQSDAMRRKRKNSCN